MSAATLPKTSPPPRGAPSLNGCSGAPGVTRSPLSMEQGDLPRSVNKQTAGGRGESERAKPQNRGPGAGLLRVHERAGFCAAVACGAMFRVHRRGRRGVQAPGALGKGQSRGQRGERAGGREPRERSADTASAASWPRGCLQRRGRRGWGLQAAWTPLARMGFSLRSLTEGLGATSATLNLNNHVLGS